MEDSRTMLRGSRYAFASWLAHGQCRHLIFYAYDASGLLTKILGGFRLNQTHKLHGLQTHKVARSLTTTVNHSQAIAS